MRGLIRDAAVILGAVLLLGTLANLAPARHLAWWGKGHEPPAAGKDYQLVDPGSADAMRTTLPHVILLDTRSAAEFTSGHVPTAQPISYTELRTQLTPERLEQLGAADAVIVYGSSEETDIEQLVAQELHSRGLAPPYVLLGGYPAWEGAGLPVETGGPR